MADTINISVSASLKVAYDLRLNPLKTRGLRELASQAQTLIAMSEANRVVKALHQVRANLETAKSIVEQTSDDEKARRELTRIIAATQGILRKVLVP